MVTKRQQGFSLSGVFFGLLFLACVLYLGMSLGPVYLDNYRVKTVLNGINRSGQELRSRQELKLYIFKNFLINDLRFFSEKDVKIGGSVGHLWAKVNYERQVPLFKNISLLVSFKNSWSESP